MRASTGQAGQPSSRSFWTWLRSSGATISMNPGSAVARLTGSAIAVSFRLM